jgi:hypothetical protein
MSRTFGGINTMKSNKRHMRTLIDDGIDPTSTPGSVIWITGMNVFGSATDPSGISYYVGFDARELATLSTSLIDFGKFKHALI